MRCLENCLPFRLLPSLFSIDVATVVGSSECCEIVLFDGVLLRVGGSSATTTHFGRRRRRLAGFLYRNGFGCWFSRTELPVFTAVRGGALAELLLYQLLEQNNTPDSFGRIVFRLLNQRLQLTITGSEDITEVDDYWGLIDQLLNCRMNVGSE